MLFFSSTRHSSALSPHILFGFMAPRNCPQVKPSIDTGNPDSAPAQQPRARVKTRTGVTNQGLVAFCRLMTHGRRLRALGGTTELTLVLALLLSRVSFPDCRPNSLGHTPRTVTIVFAVSYCFPIRTEELSLLYLVKRTFCIAIDTLLGTDSFA
jgi:hypothetical protein